MEESQDDGLNSASSISAPVTISMFRTGGVGGMRIKKTATVKPEGFSANSCFTEDPLLWQYVIVLHHILLERKTSLIDSLSESEITMIADQFSYHIALTDSSGETIDGNFHGRKVPKIVPECFNILPFPEK